MNPLLSDYMALSSINPLLLFVILVWSLTWKGIALWKAAGKKSKYWFVIILVVNTVGILEILYYYLFSKMDMKGKEMKIKEPKKKSRKQKV